jgi:hypothetical protein
MNQEVTEQAQGTALIAHFARSTLWRRCPAARSLSDALAVANIAVVTVRR